MSDRTNRADHASASDFDDRLKRVDEARWLASRYARPEDRRRLVALYLLNHELSRAVRVSEPMLGRIRLQWWREALMELSEGQMVRRHEVLGELEAAFSSRTDMLQRFDRLVDQWEQRLEDGKVADGEHDVAVMMLAAQVIASDVDARSLETIVEALAAGPVRRVDLKHVDQRIWPALVHRAAVDRRGQTASGLRARWRVLKAMLTGIVG